jgi:predicted DNA-binding transcriptional regulator YafY
VLGKEKVQIVWGLRHMNSNDEWLQQWREADQVTIETSRDPLAKLLLEVCSTGDGVDIIYFGGSTPGGSRIIFPHRLFKVKGYNLIYVEAYCRTRGADRTFGLDKIKLAHSTYVAGPRYETTTPRQATRSTVRSSSSTGCLMYLIAGVLTVLFILALAFGIFSI